jgi:preprotein translocase subunit SecB
MTEAEQAAPQFSIEKLYVKDMSLELPNAPQIFLEQVSPEIEINMHNLATTLPQPGWYEVALTVTVTARAQEKTIFLVEVAQAGIFQILNLADADLDAVLGVLCPNTLLPYAREVISNLIMRAGFPPVYLQHINFDVAYQERLRQLQQAQATQPLQSH